MKEDEDKMEDRKQTNPEVDMMPASFCLYFKPTCIDMAPPCEKPAAKHRGNGQSRASSARTAKNDFLR